MNLTVRSDSRRAVFLDRDGTILVEKDYLDNPEEVELFPQAGKALRSLMDTGFSLIVVTNQSGIGRGYYTEADMHGVNDRMETLLKSDGVVFDRIYFAPEKPDEPSRGRKPSPQFLFDARDEFGIELGKSFMVGDKCLDLECGWNAGVKESILVRTGYGREHEARLVQAGHKVVVENDLTGVAERILRLERGSIDRKDT